MANPVLVISTRADLSEYVYRGVCCVVNEQNEIIDWTGDIYIFIFPCSVLKFFLDITLISYR